MAQFGEKQFSNFLNAIKKNKLFCLYLLCLYILYGRLATFLQVSTILPLRINTDNSGDRV